MKEPKVQFFLLILILATCQAFVTIPVDISPRHCKATNTKGAQMSAEQSTFKFLVLHGKGDTKENFSRVLAPLQKGLKAPDHIQIQWDFLTAPHELSPGHFAWWTLPPGVRSFDAKEYLGIEKSFQLIEEAWKQDGPYDAILGHSQGAIILSVIIAKALLEGYAVQPKHLILCGAAWPKPFEGLLFRMGELDWNSLQYKPRTMHCLSPKDSINPPDMAERIKDLCKLGASTYVHDGGHTVPQDKQACETFSRHLFE